MQSFCMGEDCKLRAIPMQNCTGCVSLTCTLFPDGQLSRQGNQLQIYHLAQIKYICGGEYFNQTIADMACTQIYQRKISALSFNNSATCGGQPVFWLKMLGAWGATTGCSTCIELLCENEEISTEGNVRIQNFQAEIFSKNQWGPVCNDQFTQ